MYVLLQCADLPNVLSFNVSGLPVLTGNLTKSRSQAEYAPYHNLKIHPMATKAEPVKTSQSQPKTKARSSKASDKRQSTKSTKKTSTEGDANHSKNKKTIDLIRESYLDVLLGTGEAPPTVYKFVKDLGMSEEDFYKHFPSFEAIEEEIWIEFMNRTFDILDRDENYASFTAREKLLAFFFTHLEVLKLHRSYALLRIRELRRFTGTPSMFRAYKKRFTKFANALVDEALITKEIAPRPFISDRYHSAIWLQLMFVLNFWAEDRSPGFERSDAAVEKAVNLSFKILGDTTPDSIIDFAKFLWQSR